MTGTSISRNEKVVGLTGERAKLVRLLLEEKSRSAATVTPVPRAIGGSLPHFAATWAQQRLWFIDRLERGSAAYNTGLALRIRGDLSAGALRQSLDELVRRHEVLRTVFCEVDGEPKQQLTDVRPFQLILVDLSSLSGAEQERRVRDHKREEAESAFDLERGPLVRGRLLKLAFRDHVLLITMHHIVTDGWSKGVLLDELAELYEAACSRRPSELTPLAIQYADYAEWQRRSLDPATSDRDMQYWRDQLSGAPPQLELPTDRPRPAVQTYRGGNVPFVLDPSLAARLRELAQRRNMTLFMVLYAGWTILLARLSGQEDVVVGTPVANRPRPELERLIGLFVNTLVLRAQPRLDLRVTEFLENVKRTTLAAFDRQAAPFEKIVEAVQPQRSLSRNPLFQVMFGLQNAPRSDLRLGPLEVTLEPGVDELAMVDLQLTLEERGQSIAGVASYASDLFDRQTIERWLESYSTLLEGLARSPEGLIADLPLITAGEREVLRSFNASHVPYPQGQLVHGLFEEQVARTPDAVALAFEGRTLSYRELNARANQLARFLQSRGVEPDSLVGVCAERSFEMVIALLGILKAGGAYVPLDPGYPADRLSYMLEDAAPKVLLTQEHLRSRIPTASALVVALDGEEREAIAKQDAENLDHRQIGPYSRHLAYVIYTSGSTGRPKGAMNEHRGVVNRLQWMQDAYRLGTDDRILQKTPFSFDVSVWEFFWPLMTGARLVLARPEGHKDPIYLRQLIAQAGITRLHFVPSMLQAFLDGWTPGDCPSIRQVVCSGEELSAALRNLFFQCLPGAKLSNLYGPTEAAVDVTAWECTPADTSARVPIGRPVANLRMHVLDSRGQEVPIGVAGELFIGGIGVGRGYLNRPELTAERFLPDTFSGEEDSKLYKTGDLGRWRADGAIEYLGRNDFQVKIRGFRIELGEIEAQLARHPGVKEVAVTVLDDSVAGKRLVAYAVPQQGVELTADALRAHLLPVLPEHMIPSAFVVMDAFPLSPNGKLDRRALPAPQAVAYVSRQYEPPEGERESLLAGIWQELLKRERIGRHDNFFELGGHSLLIVRMLERLRRAGWSAEIRSVFERPALTELAAALTRGVGGVEPEIPSNRIPPDCTVITPDMLPLVRLEPAHIEAIVRHVPGGARNIQDIYPLAPLQEGILFHHVLEGSSADVYARTMLVSLPSKEKLERFIEATQAVVDRHDALRTAVLWEGLPEAVQVVHRKARVPVEHAEIDPNLPVLEQLREQLKREQPFTLGVAPMIRLKVASEPRSGACYVLLETHHLVCDNESLEVLLGELRAHMAGTSASLPVPFPYRDHVAQALARNRAGESEAFFRRKFGDVDEPTAPFGLLNVRASRSAVTDCSVALNDSLAGMISAEARRHGVTVAALFHAAWALVLRATTARDDVVFGSVLLGRMQGRGDAQRTVGMFINTLPLRVQFQDVSARQLVEQVQRGIVELLAHEQAPLATAQRCSGVGAGLPLFTTLLNFRHGVAEPASSPEQPFDMLDATGRTNYPLLLSVDAVEDRFALKVQADRPADAERVMGYVVTALESLARALEAGGDSPARSLSILPERERQKVIEEFNATAAPYDAEALIHELFEAQVERTPDAIAVEFENETLTYAQLNARANQLARYLRDRGVGPDVLVAVCIERSPEMVIALMGVLKAGGAYVPLDPAYPVDRLEQMLDDASPALVLTQHSLMDRLPRGRLRVALDTRWNEIGRQPGTNLDLRSAGLHSRHLAYVIYTSGSTGKPKGAMNEHRALINRLQWMQGAYRLDERDRVLQKTPFSFDVSVWEFFWTLMTGARLVVARPRGHQDPDYLKKLIEARGITTLHFVPSMLQVFLAEHPKQSCRSVRHVVCSGEELPASLQRRFFECLPHAELHNLYGPTEAAIDVTAWECSRDDQSPQVPIGRPISNVRMYVLDRDGAPVPIGVPGELHIGGVGVGRGYLNRPELTRERFVPDPFSGDVQARLYKTGDLARWRADGVIDYLGRNDFQIKIRGFRIELGEIEAALRAHPDIQEAVVVAREDAPGEKRLVAYCKARPDATAQIEAVRELLKARLPEYMVPAAFVCLERFPLSPNGKLDRRALPAPDLHAFSAREYLPPEGELEETLVAIWRTLLSVEKVGRRDNFFDLGGHSLHAVRLITQISAQCGVQLPLLSVFQSPTVAEMATLVEALTPAARFEQPPEEAESEAGVI
jgi:amino acid adenylation domain-containing protein